MAVGTVVARNTQDARRRSLEDENASSQVSGDTLSAGSSQVLGDTPRGKMLGRDKPRRRIARPPFARWTSPTRPIKPTSKARSAHRHCKAQTLQTTSLGFTTFYGVRASHGRETRIS